MYGSMSTRLCLLSNKQQQLFSSGGVCLCVSVCKQSSSVLPWWSLAKTMTTATATTVVAVATTTTTTTTDSDDDVGGSSALLLRRFVTNTFLFAVSLAVGFFSAAIFQYEAPLMTLMMIQHTRKKKLNDSDAGREVRHY